ncbi:hypothetical protein HZB69_04245 [Candidatus Amesbacteria bacterium]|nr:hypothetical protein [Candidatus Amesbacteria bacterium]
MIIDSVNEEISLLAGELFRDYYASNGIGIIDCFIAATAMERRKKLATHNSKHFKFIKDLELIIPY